MDYLTILDFLNKSNTNSVRATGRLNKVILSFPIKKLITNKSVASTGQNLQIKSILCFYLFLGCLPSISFYKSREKIVRDKLNTGEYSIKILLTKKWNLFSFLTSNLVDNFYRFERNDINWSRDICYDQKKGLKGTVTLNIPGLVFYELENIFRFVLTEFSAKDFLFHCNFCFTAGDRRASSISMNFTQFLFG
jgi:hypothetical protein